ncbi:MAG: hypothetical protein LCH90_19750 [Proteobacteria bacterium]|nr:hypothetical protein [Pseudomonadota bacterium]
MADDSEDLMAQHFRSNYNSRLTPEEDEQFGAWAKQNGRDQDDYDYDIRGAWKELQSGQMQEADNGHLGDKYKKPNHPTFSNQSIYHGTESPMGGRYEGGEWSEAGDEFRPSKQMLYQTHGAEWLKRYMQDREPNVKLVLPEGY